MFNMVDDLEKMDITDRKGNWESFLYKQTKFCAMYLLRTKKNVYRKLHIMVLKPVIKAVIESAMVFNNGNKSKAAECLGMNRGTLNLHLNRYFNKEEYDRIK